MNSKTGLYLPVLILLLLCTPLSQASQTFKFIAEKTISNSKPILGATFGGISGISYDPKSKLLYGVSDDRSRYAPSRFYSFSLKVSPTTLDVIPKKLTELINKDGSTYAFLELDPEGIALSESGSLFISTEGGRKLSIKLARSEILEFSKEGKLISKLNTPDHVLPDTEFFPNRGTLSNRGFEGLSISPDGNYLFAAVETPLYQDGNQPNLKSESKIRILRFKKSASGFSRNGEWAYPLSKIPPTANKSIRSGIGISEILALSETELWLMERAHVGNNVSLVKIFEADISNAKDVSSLTSLSGVTLKLVTKKEILDLNKILKPHGIQPDNLEAMTFGPNLENGNRTLIIASDNNFNNVQKNQFLLFEIERKSNPAP